MPPRQRLQIGPFSRATRAPVCPRSLRFPFCLYFCKRHRVSCSVRFLEEFSAVSTFRDSSICQDFYSAWDVIAKHVQNYSASNMVAHSPCLLLKWDAMDAQAYPEASVDTLKILWNIGTSKDFRQASLWSKARASAFVALASYEHLSTG